MSFLRVRVITGADGYMRSPSLIHLVKNGKDERRDLKSNVRKYTTAHALLLSQQNNGDKYHSTIADFASNFRAVKH